MPAIPETPEYPEPCSALLTPDDTWCMWIDAHPMSQFWCTTVAEHTEQRDHTDAGSHEVLAWSVELVEDETGARFTLDHDTMIATMRRIVADRESIQLASDIVDQIGAVLAAPTHEDATDELCQLDCIGDDAIVQIGLLGELTYS